MQDKSANKNSQEPVALYARLSDQIRLRLQQRAQKESGLTSFLLGDRTTKRMDGRTEERSFVPFADSAKPKRTGRKTFQANEAPFLSPAAAACAEVGLEDP